MVVDAPLLEEGRPHVLRKAEVGEVVTVQVADLAAADSEGELLVYCLSNQVTS